uniref:Uncharacterized protein n=1 Tax=Arundo donax TaxID=35708 RepID=A0A0A9E958_ARUDO
MTAARASWGAARATRAVARVGKRGCAAQPTPQGSPWTMLRQRTMSLSN